MKTTAIANQPIDSWNQKRTDDQIHTFLMGRHSAMSLAEKVNDQPELELDVDLEDFFKQYQADSY